MADMNAEEPALSLVADDLACPDADVSQYIQDVDDNDVQDLDYSLAIQEYIPGHGQVLESHVMEVSTLSGTSTHHLKWVFHKWRWMLSILISVGMDCKNYVTLDGSLYIERVLVCRTAAWC